MVTFIRSKNLELYYEHLNKLLNFFFMKIYFLLAGLNPNLYSEPVLFLSRFSVSK